MPCGRCTLNVSRRLSRTIKSRENAHAMHCRCMWLMVVGQDQRVRRSRHSKGKWRRESWRGLSWYQDRTSFTISSHQIFAIYDIYRTGAPCRVESYDPTFTVQLKHDSGFLHRSRLESLHLPPAGHASLSTIPLLEVHMAVQSTHS